MQTHVKTYTLILALATMLLTAGCADSTFRDEPVVPGTPGTVTITLKNSNMSRSQASDNSEFLIADLAIALYPAGSADDVPATVFKTFPAINEQNSTTVTMRLTDDEIATLFGAEATPATSQCRMYVLGNITGHTIGTSTLPPKPTVQQMKDLSVMSDFKTAPVQTSFVMAGEGTVSFTKATESYLQGTGTGSATLYRAAAKIMLNLRIPRQLVFRENDGTVTEIWNSVAPPAGVTPANNPLRALLNSGVYKSVAAPAIPWQPANDDAYYYSDPAQPNVSPRYFSNTGNETTGEGETQMTYDLYTMEIPFYSYPNVWQETADEKYKTSITLRVPWQKEGSSGYTTMYYVVPVTPVTLNHIDRNYSYNINLTVGMLGSRAPETPVELTDLSYQVVDWAEDNIDIKIPDTRYLVVNPMVYTVNNESEILIPYYTSHPVEISDITMTYRRFNFYSNGNGDVVDIPISKMQIDRSVYPATGTPTDTIVGYSIYQDPFTKQMTLRIKHNLKTWTPVNTSGTEVALTGRSDTGQNTLTNVLNSINKYVFYEARTEDAYSPYVIKVTIRHKDNTKFKAENITITQYPAMYIEPKRNPGGGTTSYNGTTAIGNVIVNNGYIGTYSQWSGTYPIIGSMTNELSGDNANPNMYVITVSQLNLSSEYTIGDPRSPYYNNNLSGTGALTTPTQNGNAAGAYTGNFNNYQNNGTGNNWCRRAAALYPNTSQRTLTYYYPTIEDKDEYSKMIAPKFRVASSYGKTYPVNRQGARRRMATYQELDCPAGRWRLPTYGELQYIISLSSTGKIPILFTSGSEYWTAQGACTVNSDGTITLTTETSAYVRGVYDEWYWEKYPEYSISPTGANYTYTLGDMPRNPQ